MTLVNLVYNNLFRRTSTFTVTILVSALFFERAYDAITETAFESLNRGKLWDHIKHKYE